MKSQIVLIFLRKMIYDIRLEPCARIMWIVVNPVGTTDLPAYKKPYLKVGHCGV